MNDAQEMLCRHYQSQEPGEDFEEQVFKKIKRKKLQRRAGYSLAALAATAALLLFLQSFLPRPLLRPFYTSQPKPAVKEEVPLQEHLYFAAFDAQARYGIEPISYLQASKNGKNGNKGI